MKYLIFHTGATKRRVGGFYICLEIIKICPQHQAQQKAQPDYYNCFIYINKLGNVFKMCICSHVVFFSILSCAVFEANFDIFLKIFAALGSGRGLGLEKYYSNLRHLFLHFYCASSFTKKWIIFCIADVRHPFN